ncbi:hypothetical protein EMIHUDRAFT_230341 [Emiliania huxleyi CCMP1516]|uniref:Uncharacterized protein n=2 Tax=Emiliania huxleyi TaxID=2903 RepID=A0A0D3KAH9_EMIH1|nr:hypothetical protein EMIHUDRAFT_230341 [Emiliania huxleyi CCMP1516]EOD32764.1 hypothetical protein EMIHUDRAFT_230341 [Emiliania huxleyi CCMP1516]|eukprot:XP_005785193.1 hypothetical protein EMIHUDRAFT_230341 [Emiliania huxleyi CCMP1516]
MLPRQADIDNRASNGPWSTEPSSGGLSPPPYRIINQTGRCTGKRMIVFAAPLEESHLWTQQTNAVVEPGLRLPPYRVEPLELLPVSPEFIRTSVHTGIEYVNLFLSKGTLCPARAAKKLSTLPIIGKCSSLRLSRPR